MLSVGYASPCLFLTKEGKRGAFGRAETPELRARSRPNRPGALAPRPWTGSSPRRSASPRRRRRRRGLGLGERPVRRAVRTPKEVPVWKCGGNVCRGERMGDLRGSAGRGCAVGLCRALLREEKDGLNGTWLRWPHRAFISTQAHIHLQTKRPRIIPQGFSQRGG